MIKKKQRKKHLISFHNKYNILIKPICLKNRKGKILVMFEQDYIMRLIHEMVRAILKLLFHIDTESQLSQLVEESKSKEEVHSLLELIDNGKINEAENKLYDLLLENNLENKTKNLKTALLFYNYLNEKSDSFLEENNFSREEVQSGLKNILSKYGFNSITETFLENS